MSDSRVRIWFSLFVLVVFCVGLAGGVLVDRAMARRAYVERGFDRPAGGRWSSGRAAQGVAEVVHRRGCSSNA